MKKPLRDKWITALTSGDYKQGRCRLYWEKTGAYCCLGVLRHLVDPEDDRSSWGDDLMLNPEQLTEFGLEARDHEHLVRLNDGDAAYHREVQTFDQIADWIEENL